MKVKLFNLLSKSVGKKELELDNIENVRDLLQYFSEVYGEKVDRWIWQGSGMKRTLMTGTLILVNGRHVQHLQGLETPLKEEDVISIFPPSGGG
jgi:molybdopterin synthase sulfur carrier subunit